MQAAETWWAGLMLTKIPLTPSDCRPGYPLCTCVPCAGERRLELSIAVLSHTAVMMPGGALLAALVAGDSAEDFEREDPKESARKVLRVLRGMYQPMKVIVPAPLQVPDSSFCLLDIGWRFGHCQTSQGYHWLKISP